MNFTERPFRRPFHCLCVAAGLLALDAAQPATAQEYTGHDIGSSSHLNRGPLQELVGKLKQPGNIYLFITKATLQAEGTVYQPYCLPRIDVVNSSNETVSELIFGIRYTGTGGKAIGSTVTRFSKLQAGAQDFDDVFHDTLKIKNCTGLAGEVEVVRCVYYDGGNCAPDVRALAHGAVPLQLAATAKEKK